jgi:hypothetical protein
LRIPKYHLPKTREAMRLKFADNLKARKCVVFQRVL